MTDAKRIATARASWQRLLAQLHRAPITDAQKLTDEILSDLDLLFPLPAIAPRAANVINMFDWMLRTPRRRPAGRQ